MIDSVSVDVDSTAADKMLDRNELILSLYRAGKTTREIASVVGLGSTRVGTIVKAAGISRRIGPRLAAARGKVSPAFDLTSSRRDFLDGLMLSDGHIDRPGAEGGSKYSQTCVRRTWLESLAAEFDGWGVLSAVGESRPGCVEFQLQTRRYRTLVAERERWYPNGGEKRVPRDVNLFSPCLLRNWIAGDGTRCGSDLRICTDGFCPDDVEWLMCRLRDGGYAFETSNMGPALSGRPKLRLRIGIGGGRDRLLAASGGSVPEYSYKWAG
jgi:hypothetical protein